MIYKVIFSRVYEIDEDEVLERMDEEDIIENPMDDRYERVACEIATNFLIEEMPLFLDNVEDFVSAKVEIIN